MTFNQIFIVRMILNLVEEISWKKRVFPENTEGKRNFLFFYLRYLFQIAFSQYFFSWKRNVTVASKTRNYECLFVSPFIWSSMQNRRLRTDRCNSSTDITRKWEMVQNNSRQRFGARSSPEILSRFGQQWHDDWSRAKNDDLSPRYISRWGMRET